MSKRILYESQLLVDPIVGVCEGQVKAALIFTNYALALSGCSGKPQLWLDAYQVLASDPALVYSQSENTNELHFFSHKI